MEREPFSWANEGSRYFLNKGYLTEDQTVEKRVRDIANRAEELTNIEGFSDKFYDYMSKGYYSLSSPVWSNYGNERGLPVSCFGSYIEDNMSSILYTNAEVGMLSKFGGGTSGYLGEIRPRGSEIKDNGSSFGSVHFLELFQTLTNVVSQGSVRRGFFSPYLPIEHADAEEFIGIGSDGHKIQGLNHGITVSNDFIQKMKDGDQEARKKWAMVLKNRVETGYPYIFFSDVVNENTVDVYKDNEMKIYASNMCSEIALPSKEDESFVCVLSAMNILYYDEWKNTDAVETLTIFLDTVVEEFIQKIERYKHSNTEEGQQTFNFMKRVYKFAKRHRALGLGALGWHHYLQSKMISFESQEAAKLNREIFKFIHERSWQASKDMVELYGEPELLEGYGRRNTTLTALMPTKSSSFILGQVSPSIEPEFSNYYVKDLAKTKTTIKNPYLEKLLEDKGYNTYEIWDSIKRMDGSVQHLNVLTQEEKDVFKTIFEINPKTMIDQAGIRQEFVDQAQSLNLMIDPEMSPKEINEMYLYAWQLGVKTLYYQYNLNAAQTLVRKKYMNSTCVACEG